MKVLFVCVENSNRSQMAQAFARIHGGNNIEALSAGSRPAGLINPKAINAMREIGYDLTAHSSISLDDIPQIIYDAVVTMGCGDACPWIAAHNRFDWQIPDPRNMDNEEFKIIRDLIETHVVHLISDLQRSTDK